MYNSDSIFVYIAKDHHNQSSYYLSPKLILLLTIFPMLHITSPWLIYFISGSFYLLIPITQFVPNHPPLANTNLFSVPMRQAIFLILQKDVVLKLKSKRKQPFHIRKHNIHPKLEWWKLTLLAFYHILIFIKEKEKRFI